MPLTTIFARNNMINASPATLTLAQLAARIARGAPRIAIALRAAVRQRGSGISLSGNGGVTAHAYAVGGCASGGDTNAMRSASRKRLAGIATSRRCNVSLGYAAYANYRTAHSSSPIVTKPRGRSRKRQASALGASSAAG
jgi:hypothetical protein